MYSPTRFSTSLQNSRSPSSFQSYCTSVTLVSWSWPSGCSPEQLASSQRTRSYEKFTRQSKSTNHCVFEMSISHSTFKTNSHDLTDTLPLILIRTETTIFKDKNLFFCLWTWNHDGTRETMTCIRWWCIAINVRRLLFDIYFCKVLLCDKSESVCNTVSFVLNSFLSLSLNTNTLQKHVTIWIQYTYINASFVLFILDFDFFSCVWLQCVNSSLRSEEARTIFWFYQFILIASINGKRSQFFLLFMVREWRGNDVVDRCLIREDAL